MSTIEERKTKLAQKKAQLQKEEAAIRNAERKQATKQKIVAGGLILNIVKSNAQVRSVFLSEAQKQVTRKSDLDALQPLLDGLRDLDVPPPLPKDDLEELTDEEAEEMGLTV